MNELVKLFDWLTDNAEQYGWTFEMMRGTKPQIVVYIGKTRIWDVVCFPGTYGYERGLLESMGMIVDEKAVGDTVEGYLSCEDVIERIYKTFGKLEKIDG